MTAPRAHPAFGPVAALAKRARAHRTILRDIAATSGARVYSTLISMVALVLTARWLGPQGRGIVIVVTTWVTLFSNLGYLSLGQVCVHRAANEADQQWVGPAVGALILVAGVVTAVGWASALLLYWIAGGRLFGGIPPVALVLGFAALPFFIWEQYGSALLTILGKLRTYNLNQVIARTVGLIVLIAAIRLFGLGLYGFLLATVAAQVAVASAGAAVLLHHARGQLKGGLQAVGALIRDGLKIHLNTIGVMLFSGADIVMLQYFRGPAEAGIFQLPMQLVLAMLLVPQAAQLALQAQVSSRSRADFWSEQRAIMGYVIGGMTLVAMLLWIVAPWLVILLASHRFDASVPIFRLLLWITPVAAFNTLMGIQWITRGYFLQASLVTFATGLLNCILNLFLIPRYGAIGAASATLVGVYMIPLAANGWLALSAERNARVEARRRG